MHAHMNLLLLSSRLTIFIIATNEPRLPRERKGPKRRVSNESIYTQAIKFEGR